MDNRIVIGICLIVMLVSTLVFLYFGITDKENEPKNFQGPVQPQDDEQYFRETGITKPLEVGNG